MAAYNILEARNNLSALVAAVESGDEAEVTLMRRGRPVAKIVPIGPVDVTPSGNRLAEFFLNYRPPAGSRTTEEIEEYIREMREAGE